ncbi:hypothetical protein BpHYR1_028704 [Brachionus plicatilis]|uniref:EB domain-containing protein n=1 Tax=Brachionus plicatilis TaxID=10195 RepID=A0A3M7PM99_BRAPC|nr:hypothetical protein BpHYR1_028704 [Brachionus plicatilis]
MRRVTCFPDVSYFKTKIHNKLGFKLKTIPLFCVLRASMASLQGNTYHQLSHMKIIGQDCDNDEDCKGYLEDLEIQTIKCNSQKCTCEGDYIFAPSENAEPYACLTFVDGPCKEDIHCKDDKYNGEVTVTCQNDKCEQSWTGPGQH